MERRPAGSIPGVIGGVFTMIAAAEVGQGQLEILGGIPAVVARRAWAASTAACTRLATPLLRRSTPLRDVEGSVDGVARSRRIAPWLSRVKHTHEAKRIHD
jgi:hypothetical protein